MPTDLSEKKEKAHWTRDFQKPLHGDRARPSRADVRGRASHAAATRRRGPGRRVGCKRPQQSPRWHYSRRRFRANSTRQFKGPGASNLFRLAALAVKTPARRIRAARSDRKAAVGRIIEVGSMGKASVRSIHSGSTPRSLTPGTAVSTIRTESLLSRTTRAVNQSSDTSQRIAVVH